MTVSRAGAVLLPSSGSSPRLLLLLHPRTESVETRASNKLQHFYVGVPHRLGSYCGATTPVGCQHIRIQQHLQASHRRTIQFRLAQAIPDRSKRVLPSYTVVLVGVQTRCTEVNRRDPVYTRHWDVAQAEHVYFARTHFPVQRRR